MAQSVKIEGIPALVKQFPGIRQEILEAANGAAKTTMQTALSTAKSTRLFQDRGRKNASPGNPAHEPGNLRSKLTLFTKDTVKRGKLRVWTSLGVPYGSGAAYYIPLALGHKARGRKDAKKFFEEAFASVQSSGEAGIVAAINGVLAKYPPEAPK